MLQDQDFQLLKQHLEQFPTMVCPVCGDAKWQLSHIIVTPLYTMEAEGPVYQPTGIPVALASCNTCFYLRQFAWQPISKGLDKKKDVP